MSKVNIREVALSILLKIEKSNSFSHLLIDKEIKQKQINRQDANLLTEIVYGTLQNKLQLDYFIFHFSKRKKMQMWVKVLLRLSFYQMAFLDRVPDHAIIYESVEIAKKRGHRKIHSFINGVLRTAQRKGLPTLQNIKDPIERLSIETSHPKWLVKRWTDQYGLEKVKKITYANTKKQLISLRIQPLKITREKAIQTLENEGFKVSKSLLSPQGIIIKKGNITESSLLKKGQATVQDESSMLVGHLLEVNSNMKVLDACSAPGGKATHIAELMENKGTVIAVDLHEKKLNLIERRKNELNLNIIKTLQSDARNLYNQFSNNSFDRILVDAPCSGLGVLRTKPDIRYNKSIDDIKRLSEIQLEILQKVAPLLKKDGKLIYSTCTIDRLENEEVIKRFLERNSDFEMDKHFIKQIPEQFKTETENKYSYGLQIFPHTLNTDGFFIARLKRKT